MSLRRLALALVGLLALAAAPACSAPPPHPHPAAPAPTHGARGSPFADWAVVLAAGDDRLSGGAGESQGFDNARRDLAKALAAAGFSPAHMVQLTAHEATARAEHLPRTDVPNLIAALDRAAKGAPGGCLFYITSHGSQLGAVAGIDLLTPERLARMLDQACPGRPTVAIVSACYSGVFLEGGMKAADRLILTAASADRTSFGCGQTDRYPYFDDCLLSQLPDARDVFELGRAAQTCVVRREVLTGAHPPSEPQLFLGNAFKERLPRLRFVGRSADAAPPPQP